MANQPQPQPDWQFIGFWLDELMHQGANLARCTAQMGLHHLVTLPRRAFSYWPVEPHRIPTEREMLATGSSVAARGFQAKLWPADALAALDRPGAPLDGLSRAQIDDQRMGAPVISLGERPLPRPGRIILLDTWDLSWRTTSGGALGDGVVSLGAWRWGCSTGKAAARLAKICRRRFPTHPAKAVP